MQRCLVGGISGASRPRTKPRRPRRAWVPRAWWLPHRRARLIVSSGSCFIRSSMSSSYRRGRGAACAPRRRRRLGRVPRGRWWALMVLGLPRRAHASMASRRSVVEQVYDRLAVESLPRRRLGVSQRHFWSWTVGFSVEPDRRRAAVDSSIGSRPPPRRAQMANSSAAKYSN